jgi:outer membrane biosynthesis protein TonB
LTQIFPAGAVPNGFQYPQSRWFHLVARQSQKKLPQPKKKPRRKKKLPQPKKNPQQPEKKLPQSKKKPRLLKKQHLRLKKQLP